MASKFGSVTKTVDTTLDLMRSLNELASVEVLVGVPAQAEARDDGSITNAALAYIHETGAPEANIPARPFIRPGVQNDKDNIVHYLRQASQAAFAGKRDAMMKAFNLAGLSAVNSIKKKITEGPFEPLKPATIAARRRRRRGKRA